MKVNQTYFCILLLLLPYALIGQIGIGTSTPKAALDVVSTTQGILPPRMTGAQVLALTVGAEQNSMLVYATSPSGAITKIGYWYYDHITTSWKPFDADITATNGVNISSGNIRLGGALTQATTISGLTATNKISFTGTGTDAFNIDGTTFSVDATNDRIGVGMTNPQYKLDVIDDIRVSSNRINFTSARLLLEGGQVDGGLQGSGMYILDGQANGLRRQWYIGKPYNLTGLGIGSLQSDIFAASAANSPNTHLYVDGVNNRVGIGTTTPNSRLDLGTSFGSTTTDVVGKKLAVYNNAAGTDFYGLGISSALLQFHAASTASEDAGMVLNSGGSVGIGTVTPSERLHIFGGNALIGGTGTNSVANPMLRIWSNANVNGSGGFIEFNEADNTYGYTFRHNTNPGAYGDDGVAFEVKSAGTYSPKVMFSVSGNVGMGTTTPKAKLDLSGIKSGAGTGTGGNNDAASQLIAPAGNNGSSRYNDWPNGWGGGMSTWDIVGASTFFNSYLNRSDEKLKECIQPLDENIANKFMQLKPVSYYFKEKTKETEGLQYGFIAQEVAQVFPDLISDPTCQDSIIGMNYIGLIAPTVSIVQKQASEIKDLKIKIEQLRNSLKKLEEENLILRESVNTIVGDLKNEIENIKKNLSPSQVVYPSSANVISLKNNH